MQWQERRVQVESAVSTWRGMLPAPPRLLFGGEEVHRLRARATGIPGFVDTVRGKAYQWESELASRKDPRQATLGETMRGLQTLTDGYSMTGDEELRERLQGSVEQVLSLATWVAPVHRPMAFDHVCANVAAAVALSLDALAMDSDADALARQRHRLAEKVVEPFRVTYEGRMEPWVERTDNWKSMICSDMILAILVVWEHCDRPSDVLRHCVNGIFDVLDACPDSGEYFEGFTYWYAAVGRAARANLALRRCTAGELDLLAHPYFERTVDFFVHAVAPTGRPFHFSDSRERLDSLTDWMAQYLAAMAGRALPSITAHRPESVVELVLSEEIERERARLGADPARARTAASVPRIPLAKHFTGCDLVTLRSGWDRDDTFVAIKGGPVDVSHAHLDVGDFLLVAQGETLVADAAKWPYAHPLGFFDRSGPRWDFPGNATQTHSTLLVDGRGQLSDREVRGEVVGFMPGEDADHVVLDATSAYRDRLVRFHRHVVFVKPDLLLIVDDVRAKEAPRRVEWLLQPRGDLHWGDDIAIVQGRAGLHLRFLLPRRDAGWISEERSSRTVYPVANTGETARIHQKTLSFQTLHPVTDCLFVAALSLFELEPGHLPDFSTAAAGGDRHRLWRCKTEHQDDRLSLVAVKGERTETISVGL